MRLNRNWRMYEFQGQMRNLSEIARMVGVLPVTLKARMDRYGMTFEQAIDTPDQRTRRARQAKEAVNAGDRYAATDLQAVDLQGENVVTAS